MKRCLKWLILIVLPLLLYAHLAFAVGTVAITSQNVRVSGVIAVKIITLSWVADSAAATVPDTTITANTYGITGWYLYSAETNPGTTAPTDNYDIIINDADGFDIAGGLLANRDTSNTEMVNMGNSAVGYPLVRGDLIFSLSNNAVNSATGVLILIFVAH